MIHPRQLLLDGTEHRHHPRPSLRRWLEALTQPMTVAELAAAWEGLPEPRAWRVGSYPSAALVRARGRVRRLCAAGLVAVHRGPLTHRTQEGLIVVPTGAAPSSAPLFGARHDRPAPS